MISLQELVDNPLCQPPFEITFYRNGCNEFGCHMSRCTASFKKEVLLIRHLIEDHCPNELHSWGLDPYQLIKRFQVEAAYQAVANQEPRFLLECMKLIFRRLKVVRKLLIDRLELNP